MHRSTIAELPKFVDFKSIDYAVAHNAPYDYTVLSRYIKEIKDLKWVCSQRDFNHDKHLKRRATSKRLGHLAVDYGIPLINYHRAVDDCMTLLQLCFKHDVVEAYEVTEVKKTLK